MAKEALAVEKSKTSALQDIFNKKFGAGSLFKLGDKPEVFPAFSTGSIGLDNALGIGGVPKGRITEIYGGEASGKTSICLQVAASCQKEGGKVAYIDAENALDIKHARLLGVNVDEMFMSQPDTAQQTFAITEELIKSGEIQLIIIDSVAALVSEQELNGDYGDSNIGIIARLMSQACRKLTPLIAKHDVAVMFVNQERDMIGVMFGPNKTTTGGKALKYFASVRIEAASSTQVKDGDTIVGRRMKYKVVKNKLAPPFLTAEFDVTYGENWLKYNELIELGAELKIVDKSGSWYSYNNTKLGQGIANTRQYLIENPSITDEIEARVRTELGVA